MVEHPVTAARMAKLTLTMAAYEKEIYYVGDLPEIVTGLGHCQRRTLRRTPKWLPSKGLC